MKLIQVLNCLRNIIKNINKYHTKYNRHNLKLTTGFHNIDTQLIENYFEEILIDTKLFMPRDVDDIIYCLFCYGYYDDLSKELLNIKIDNLIVKLMIQSWNDAIQNMNNIDDKYKDKLNFIMCRNYELIK